MYTNQNAQTYSIETHGLSIVERSDVTGIRILPERFGSTSVPSPAGVVDFGPESSTPKNIPHSQTTDSYTYEHKTIES